jgi:hypothetical protein
MNARNVCNVSTGVGLFCKYVHLTSNCPYLVLVVSRSGGVPSVSSRGRERVQTASVIAAMQSQVHARPAHLLSKSPLAGHTKALEPTHLREAVRRRSQPRALHDVRDPRALAAASSCEARQRARRIGGYRAPARGSERGRHAAAEPSSPVSRAHPGTGPPEHSPWLHDFCSQLPHRSMPLSGPRQHAPERPATAYTPSKLRTM